MILLLIGIPSILLSFLSVFYFILINKIQAKLTRLILPPVISIIIIIALSITINSYKQPLFLSITGLLLFAAIISMGTITPFPLFERGLIQTKNWIYVFGASIITFFNLLYIDLANQSGLIRILSGVPYWAYPPILSMSLVYIEAGILASLIYGGFTLFFKILKRPDPG